MSDARRAHVSSASSRGAAQAQSETTTETRRQRDKVNMPLSKAVPSRGCNSAPRALGDGMRIFHIAALACCLLCLGGAKKPVVDLRVHALGKEEEAPSFAVPGTLMNGTQVYLQRMPLVTQSEVTSIFPFPAGDGTSGMYFKLGQHGSQLLQQHTMTRQGSTLVVMLNGVQVANLLVDRPVRDGVFRIPRGLTPEDVAFLSTVFPVMGQEAEGKKSR
jgi:hypothetical protein